MISNFTCKTFMSFKTYMLSPKMIVSCLKYICKHILYVNIFEISDTKKTHVFLYMCFQFSFSEGPAHHIRRRSTGLVHICVLY